MEVIRGGRASSRPQADGAPARGARPGRGHGELIKQVNVGNSVPPHIRPPGRHGPLRLRSAQTDFELITWVVIR